MASKGIDLATLGHAMQTAEDTFLGRCRWYGTAAQKWFFLWLYDNRKTIRKLQHLEALASRSHLELNAFSVSKGFKGTLEKFDGIGVVSVLDMKIKWAETAQLATINRSGTKHDAFKVKGEHATFYKVRGYKEPLVRLHTQTGDSLWVMMADAPTSDLSLAMTAVKFLQMSEESGSKWSGYDVVLPMLDMDLKPDLSWLIGAETNSEKDGYHQISQANQQLRVRMDENGAKGEAKAEIAMTEAVMMPPSKLVFDKPHIGFFTQKGHDEVPMACYFADTDAWRRPAKL